MQDELDTINKRVRNTFCPDTWKKLDRSACIDEIQEFPSFIQRKNSFLSYFSDDEKHVAEKLMDNKAFIIDFLITPSMLSSVVGRKFNNLVKDKILSIDAFKDAPYEIEFEKNHHTYVSAEIPDFTIYNKDTQKCIIGMNQIDLWKGGHQTNRGDKYITNPPHNDPNVLLLAVIASNEKCFFTKRNSKSKHFMLFKKGFQNDTLCYIKDIERIAKNWLNT